MGAVENERALFVPDDLSELLQPFPNMGASLFIEEHHQVRSFDDAPFPPFGRGADIDDRDAFALHFLKSPGIDRLKTGLDGESHHGEDQQDFFHDRFLK